MKIAIVDYGMGNLRSVFKAVQMAGGIPVITAKPAEIKLADKIILPGVGHFKKGMDNLTSQNLVEVLNDEVILNEKPILGICLGMQLMMQYSEEGDANGLGWFDGRVVKFQVSDRLLYKVPHMGWNSVKIRQSNSLEIRKKELEELYFVHSYHIVAENSGDILGITSYNYDFVSAIAKNNMYGFQFHPEKSHSDGLYLLRKFINK